MKRGQLVDDWSGGTNELADTHKIPANMSPRIENALIDDVGVIYTRWGVDVFGGRGTTPGGLFPFVPPVGDRRLVGFWPPSVYHSSLNTTWLQVASGCSLVTGLHGGVLGRDANAQWRLYGFSVDPSDSDPSFWHSGLLVVDPNDGSWTQRFDVRPGCAVYWQGRLWVGDSNTTDVQPDTIIWSHIWDAGDFSGYLTNNIRVDPTNGGRITALMPARGGHPLLYVFKERALYLFEVAWNADGWIPGSADDIDTTTAQIQALSYRIGCIAPLSALWVPAAEGADVFFLSHDGVRSLRRTQEDVAAGGAGLPLTYLIPDTIARINWNYARRAVATTHGHYYLLAVPLDGATHNTHVLAKNLLVGQYEGWVLWELPVKAFAADSFPTPRIFMQGAVATTDSLAAGATLAAHVFELVDDAAYRMDPGGSEVRLEFDSRSFDMQMPSVRKQWRQLELQYSADNTGTTVLLSARRDDEATYVSLGAFEARYYDSGVTLPAMLPWQFAVDKIQSIKFGLEDIDPSYRLGIRLETAGRGVLKLRQVDVVGQPLPREWV